MDCPDCGGNLKQVVTEKSDGQRRKNGIGSRAMGTSRKCRRCGEEWDTQELIDAQS